MDEIKIKRVPVFCPTAEELHLLGLAPTEPVTAAEILAKYGETIGERLAREKHRRR